MRAPALAVFVACCSACEGTPQPMRDVSALSTAAFLQGTWSAGGEDTRTQEHWSAPQGDMMVGTSVTTKDGKTAFFEYMRIERRGDKLFYVAQPRGGRAVDFELVASGPNSVTFLNPANDFPRRISYRLDGPNLIATIDGGPDQTPGQGPPAQSWRLSPSL